MTTAPSSRPPTGIPAHAGVRAWVEEMVQLCEPDEVCWCDGSEAEKENLTAQAVQAGVLIKLNQGKLPGCYLHRSNPNDVARVEDRTFICTRTPEAAGPTNNWEAPREMYERLYGLARGADRRRGRRAGPPHRPAPPDRWRGRHPPARAPCAPWPTRSRPIRPRRGWGRAWGATGPCPHKARTT